MCKMKKGSTDDVSDQDREPFVETDPSGRFGRYPELLGSGAMKNALNKVKDPELKAFIEKCIGQKRVRPSASELLNDPFLEIGDDE
ncbi:hypothetical protein Tco_0903020 [Tanacetum coccineum]